MQLRRWRPTGVLVLMLAASCLAVLAAADAEEENTHAQHCSTVIGDRLTRRCENITEPIRCEDDEDAVLDRQPDASTNSSESAHKRLVCIPKRAPKPPALPPAPWDRHYMNLYTPMPNGGLVVSDDGMHVNLTITGTNQTFAHFLSKYRFIFGYYSMYMKVVPKESAGVIATFYVSSPETKPKELDRHDEIDFEFLGNTSGNPITLQTNVFLDGVGGREQLHYLPFDPRDNFHKYSVLWNLHLIIWYVDDRVIRVFHNKSNSLNVSYPVSRPMSVQCSIWDGSEWATQGGRVKLNYTYAPFVAQYEGFNGVDACQACPTTPATACDNVDFSHCSNNNESSRKQHWFLEQEELTKRQIKQLQKHRRKYIVRDYCTDRERNPSGIFPEGCQYNSYD